MFTKIQRLLDVRPALDLRELVTIFGCTQLEHHVQKLLATYKSRLLESLPAQERGRADLNRPVFLAAAFLLTAKKQRATVDRAALMAKMGLTRNELAGAIDDMMARCEDQLAVAGAARKRRRDAGDTGVEEDAGPSGAGSRPGAAEGDDGGAGQATGNAADEPNAAKRTRRAPSSRKKAEQDDEEEHGGDQQRAAAAAADVAVEDLKLVLIGLAPGGPPAGGSSLGPQSRRARTKANRRPARKKRHDVSVEEEADVEEGAAGADDEGDVDDVRCGEVAAGRRARGSRGEQREAPLVDE